MGWWWSWQSVVAHKLRGLFQRSQEEQRLSDELEFHLEMQTRLYVDQGMDPREARLAARRQFGGVEQRAEEIRDRRGIGWVESARRDLTHSLRALRRQPSVLLLATISLAFGIGANCALVNVFEAAFLRNLPISDAERVVVLQETNQGRTSGSNPARFEDWRAQLTALDSIFGYYSERSVRTGDGPAEGWTMLRVMGDAFGVLGVRPALGRGFSVDELAGLGEPVVVLSHDLWRERFHGDPAVVGRTVTLSNARTTIIGVMPAGPSYPTGMDAWMPIPKEFLHANRRAGFLGITGRLKAGQSLAQLNAQISTVAKRLAHTYAGSDGQRSAAAFSLRDELTRESRPAFRILGVVAALVLLIACVNLTALMLSVLERRQRDAVIRVALGASRSVLIRLFLTESVLVAVMSAIPGLVLASYGVQLLKKVLPADLPNVDQVGLSFLSIAVALGLAVLCGVVSGLVPALRASQAAIQSGLKEGAAATSQVARPHMLNALVVAEISVAVVLTVASVLLGRSLVRLVQQDNGFRAERVMAMAIHLPWDTPQSKLDQLSRGILDRLSETPGVQSAGMIDRLPLTGGAQGNRMALRERALPGNASFEEISVRATRGAYLQTIGTRLLEGGFLRETANPNLRETVVNASFAHRYFPGISAVGQQLTLSPGAGATDDPKHWYTIVGVVEDVRQDALQTVGPEIFILSTQTYWPLLHFAVRTQMDPAQASRLLRGAASAVDPNVLIGEITRLDETVRESYAQPRLRSWLIGGFSVLALLLAGVGVFGVLAQEMIRRRHEFGVRLALGATRQELLQLAWRRGLRLAGAGLAIGMVLAWGAARSMASFLYGVQPTDIVSFTLAGLIVTVAAAVACHGPASRAARVDPMQALRHE